MIKSAMIQMSADMDREKNIDKAEQLVREAAEGGAQLVCLPELFSGIYFPHEISKKYFDWAEPMDGPTVTRFSGIAQETRTVIVLPIYEYAMEGLLFNSAVVIGADGAVIGKYRKSSIPHTNSPPMVGAEKYYFAPGDTGFITFDTGLGLRVGILICYDRHFPEAARLLALRGADVVFAPTATLGLARDVWQLELRAHAVANNYYVGGVNRVGYEQEGTAHFFGLSTWVGPRGDVIATASDVEDEILYADLDLEAIRAVRNDWGFLRDRRPDLYGDLASMSVER